MKHRVLIIILSALSMLGSLSIDAYLPALPTMAHDYAVALPAIQQTLTVYTLAFGVMTLFYGTLSDSFGRRPVILFSLVFYLAGTLGAGWAPTLGWLLFFRLVQGLSAGAGSVVGRAIVGDLFSGAEAQRIMSAISLLFGLAPALAPIFGGWLLAAWGWKSIFYSIALFTVVLALACLYGLPESLARKDRHAFHIKVILGHYLEVGAHARFLLRSLAMALSFSGIIVYVASAPVYILHLLHLTVKDFGWLFVTFIAGMTVGSLIAGHLSHRVKPHVVIRSGYVLMLIAVIENLAYTWFFPSRVPWAVIPHFIYGVGVAVVSPAMTVLTLEMFPRMKGLASSLQGFVFMTIFAFFSGVITPFLFSSAFNLAAGAAVGMALSWLCWQLGSGGELEHPVLSEEEQPRMEEVPHL